ncbi:M1 family aminopeptidase [Thermococcus sp. 5-4]|uniref:M1 family aminopeptidase n=1 Tax=Thermococcus sp. 5-4 TaxID=2008440 RepID=UPI000B4A0F33|nr:M1 family aminopeptidase [Thermococcus sp. 5-4]ASA78453.1 hypothetical protein CDI07_09135 [Thermococcus sp. 5-4]
MRKAVPALLVVLVILVSGCLGGNTTTGTTSTGSASNTVSSVQSPGSQYKAPPLRFIYPEEPANVNMSFENMGEFFWKTYSAVPYSQYGNISVNYTDGTFRGRYDFVLTNFTSGPLYLALLVTPNDPLTLNISIEGVPLELSRMDVYRWVDEDGVGIEIYAVNVSTNLTTLKGVVTYDFRYLENKEYIRQMWEHDVFIGTDFSWWEFASKNATVTVTPYLPKDTVFVLFDYGVVRNGSEVVYTSPIHPYLGFSLYLPNLGWTGFEASDVSFTVYYPGDCYDEEGLELVKRELTFSFGLYQNITGIKPVERFNVLFVPGFSWRISREVLGISAGAVNIGGTFIVDCPSNIGHSATNFVSTLFHELAHEWFGHYMSFGTFNEPLAEYFRMEAYTRWNQSDALGWLDRREESRAIWANGALSLRESLRRNLPADKEKYIYSVRYAKGAFMLRSLRLIVGNETFNRILHDVLEECHGSHCNYTVFIETAENVSGKNLDWFFDEWFNSTLFPNYSITNLNLSPTGEGYNLTFTIVDASNFTMPVPIRIVMENGDSLDTRVWVNRTAEVSLRLEDRPVKIIIDPDEWMANVNWKFEVEGIEVDVN